MCLACGGLRLRTHADSQQLGEDGSFQAADQLEEQLPHHQEDAEAVDGGRQRAGRRPSGGVTALRLHPLTRFAVLLTRAEPQRHLLRVQRLRSPQHPADAAVGQAGLAQHRGGAEDAPRPAL